MKNPAGKVRLEKIRADAATRSDSELEVLLHSARTRILDLYQIVSALKAEQDKRQGRKPH